MNFAETLKTTLARQLKKPLPSGALNAEIIARTGKKKPNGYDLLAVSLIERAANDNRSLELLLNLAENAETAARQVVFIDDLAK